MDDFDFEDWFTGSSYVDPGIPVDFNIPDITSFDPLNYFSGDAADAFNFGDLSSVLDLGNVDFSDAISFGDLSGITGGIEGFGDVADIIGQGAAGIPGIEGFGDIADIVGQGAAGIPGIEGFGDIADIVGQGAAGIQGIEGFGDVADIVGQGAAGIPGIEGFGDVADVVGQGAMGIQGIEGFGAAADEVGRGTTGITGIEGFGAAADEVGQGTTGITGIEGFAEAADEVGQGATTREPYEIDGAQGSRTEETALTGTTPGGKEVIKPDDKKTTPDDKKTTPDDKKSIIDRLLGGNTKDNALLLALLGGLLGLLGKGSAPKAPIGYQGGIPKYKSIRGEAMSPTAGGRRPGGANIPSLTGGYTLTKSAGGGLMDLAQGGRPARYLRGGTDGMADEIKTDIDGKQPARLSHGEFVIPADVVSHLGNGNSDAGADVLYDMMAKVRKARTGTTKQGKQINPRKMIPA